MNSSELKERTLKHGQSHLFTFWQELSESDRTHLAMQVASIDFDLVERLKEEFLSFKASTPAQATLEPAYAIPLPVSPEQKQAEAAARAAGEAALRAGRVACFMVAGGQGTRLGLEGPKGCFAVGPVTGRTLFQLHAEKILALRKRYGAAIPWIIMTSTANDQATQAYFTSQHYFGLDPESVRFCVQENLPAVSPDGKILLETKASLCLSPNGHGGSIKALHDSGSLAWLRKQSVDTLFYFQVDNPLTKIGDPVFLGYHLLKKAEMSGKVVRKSNWQERVGVAGYVNGMLGIIEYSDLPADLARATEADGRLRFWAGNIAIHVLDLGFIERLNAGGFQLPYHRAEKAVSCIDSKGAPLALKPGEKNGIKFETFVFDALPIARETVLMEGVREEDFAPIKNATGEDSPETSRKLLQDQYAAWLRESGHRIPRKGDGSLDCCLEISPLTSLAGEDLDKISIKAIKPGANVVL